MFYRQNMLDNITKIYNTTLTHNLTPGVKIMFLKNGRVCQHYFSRDILQVT